jgi:hypothetical protein
MKKIFNLFLLLFAMMQFNVIAKEVPVEQARKVAQNYFSYATDRQSSNLILAHTANMANGKPSLYVFQNAAGAGFILVSGDDIAEPVLGYSNESSFDLNTKNKAFLSWMEFYQNEIAYGISKNNAQPAEIKVKWSQYASNNFSGSSRGAGVQPLVKSKWGQDPDENAQCPLDKDENKRCVTGCPATAVAMIMKYFNHPAQGTGNSSYNHTKYGTLAVNYADQTYNYANMPDIIAGPNADVAKLMYHAGVAVEMEYTPGESGSFVIEAYCNKKEATCEYALKNYFGYDKTTVLGLQKKDFTDAVWIKKLKDELDAKRPMQYAGFGGGGHTWVCDGYDDNNKFHMNWGWRGEQDGFFALNALSPGSGGTGSGEGTYNNGQQAIIGIKPANQEVDTAPKFGLVLNSGIVLNPAVVKANTPFTLTVDLNYTGVTTFVADLSANIFTEEGNFIGYVEIQEKQSFVDKANKKYTFSTKGLDLLQGNYTIGIYSSAVKDSSWTLLKKANFINPIKFKVEGAQTALSLAAATIVPTTSVVENTDFSVTMSVKNEGTTAFDGYVAADVYDKDDDYKMTVGTPSKIKLDPGKSQDITFKSTNAALKQGTYLIVAAESLDDKEYFELSNKNFDNPVKMIVVETPIKADTYESNNTAAAPSALTPNFVNNVASIQTTGSNLHVATDLDHYGITLPTGFNYSINARVNDEKNAIDGKKYTTDVVMSYIVNNVNSSYYDEAVPAPVKIDKGGSIIFKIAPTFVGFAGTYLLDVNIVRTPITATNETFVQSNIDIYPNPASQYLTIDRSKSTADIVQLLVYNGLGQRVKTQSMNSVDTVSQLDVSDLNNGVYFVQLFDVNHNSYTTQFLIQN